MPQISAMVIFLYTIFQQVNYYKNKFGMRLSPKKLNSCLIINARSCFWGKTIGDWLSIIKEREAKKNRTAEASVQLGNKKKFEVHMFITFAELLHRPGV